MSCPVCVVGSLDMDLVVRAPRFPQPGETVVGEGLEPQPGGRGATQAVAASRLGAQVSMVGCVGDDDWGSALRGVLTSEGVDIRGVRTFERTATGVAFVTVDPEGRRTTLLTPGANAKLTSADVEEARRTITAARVLLLACEVPHEANLRAVEIASHPDALVILNASPAVAVPAELLSQVDILVVDRAEAHALVGDTEGEVAPAGLARRLASLGPERVIVTLGRDGAVHFDGSEVKSFSAFQADAVDATAAGDAFLGALAVMRGEGARINEAIRFACGAAALSASVAGGLPSLPTREGVERLVAAGNVVG